MSICRVLFVSGLLLGFACAQIQVAQRVTITVVDETGVAVPDARVALTSSDGSQVLRCLTSPAGMCGLTVPSLGPYKARVEKENFYATEGADLQFDRTTNLELTLAHQREIREVVDVVESSPAINPEQVNAQEQISGVDVINLPYPSTRDYRNVLNYIPQVVNDIYSQPHITGAETYQTLVLFDGFNATQPANGQLLLRVSTDAFRSINVQTSRVSAEYGKSSGGVLELNTAAGDDHFRFAVTDFIPTAQTKRGLALDKVTPRLTFSGPMAKGRVWFYEAADAEYDNLLVTELKPGPDDDILWRVGNLFKVQGNVTARNIVTSNFNYNFVHDQHSGISLQNPPSTTPAVSQPMYQGSLKDQYYFSGGRLLETGFGFNRYDLDQVPRGTDPYFVNPNNAGGNYYFTAHTQADRWQLYSNLFFKPLDWHGNHQLKIGVDLDHLRYDFNFQRQPIAYLSAVVQTLPPGGCAVPFNVDNPLFSTQAPGPYAWDAPNRFLSWGFLHLVKGFDFGYSMEYRTGFPFFLVNDQQQLAPLTGTSSPIPAYLRFPQFFFLNTHIEKRFHAFGYYWAIRGGFNNITGRKNYGLVNNDVDAGPQFLTFSGFEGRGFTGRIRFLGRK